MEMVHPLEPEIFSIGSITEPMLTILGFEVVIAFMQITD